MTLKEFANQMKQELTHFHDNWLDENEADPNEWPLEMDESEWFEQLIAQLTSTRPQLGVSCRAELGD